MTKHHPKNERIKRRYFDYLKEAKRMDVSSIDMAAAAIAGFEQWAKYRDFASFHIDQAKGYKAFLAKQRSAKTGKALSKATIYSRLMALKAFVFWLAGQPGYKARISYADADYFNPNANDSRIATARRDKKVPTVEQVRHVIFAMPAGSDVEKRDRAIVAFTLLTGARDNAVASFRLKHVDLEARSVFHDARDVNIHTLTGGRVEFDAERQVIRARGALTDYDKTALLLALPDAAAGMVEALVHKSRGARLKSIGEEQDAIRFAVPRLAVKTAHGLQLFDRGHFLDMPWRLENDDPAQIMDFFVPPKQARDEAHVDVDQAGHVNVEFVTDLHEQLMLNLQERGWTKNALVNWLDRRLPFTARRDITRISSTLFIAKALDLISAQTGMSLEALARAKFRLVEALVKVIAKHRDGRETQAFQQALIPQGGLDFKTSAELELVFEESRYAYREPYKGRTDFKKHLFRVIGDLEPTGEEHECAVYLERMPEVKAWVRNTSQQPNSFWLQTATDKFYPDFVALLSDGRTLVIEYKGSYIASADDAKEKRLVGELWADRSGGSCIFAMIEGKEFGRIDAAIRNGA